MGVDWSTWHDLSMSLFFSCHVSSSPKSMKNQLVEIGSYDLGAIR